MSAFAALLFCLRGVDPPIVCIPYLDFGTHMVLARQLVHKAGDGGVGDQDAGLSKGVGSPDVGEGSTAAIDPKAWVLRVPRTMQIGIGRVRVVIGIYPGAIRRIGAVATQKADIVDKGFPARVPQQARGPAVQPASKDTQPNDNIGASGRSKQERFGSAGPRKAGVPSGRSNWVVLGWRPMRMVSGRRVRVSRSR